MTNSNHLTMLTKLSNNSLRWSYSFSYFICVDEILWCHHLNETSNVVLSYGFELRLVK